GAGSPAAGSVLPNETVSAKFVATFPAGSRAVTVKVVGVPAARKVETLEICSWLAKPRAAGRSNRRTPDGVIRKTWDPSLLTVMTPAPRPFDALTSSPTGN